MRSKMAKTWGIERAASLNRSSLARTASSAFLRSVTSINVETATYIRPPSSRTGAELMLKTRRPTSSRKSSLSSLMVRSPARTDRARGQVSGVWGFPEGPVPCHAPYSRMDDGAGVPSLQIAANPGFW
ncbi:hypothetical protein DSECCO2_337440 [anaerobic digester metagenome]